MIKNVYISLIECGSNVNFLKLNIQIQMALIYRTSSASNPSSLNIKMLRTHHQPNSYDCGVFAIANVVEFCLTTNRFNFNIMYDVNKMRKHLFNCIENTKFVAFPKIKKRIFLFRHTKVF